MKQCSRCGQFSEDTNQFCASCGAQLPEAPQAAYPTQRSQMQQPSAPTSYPQAPFSDQPIPSEPPVTTKEAFLALPENKKMKTELLTSAILCYVAAGINLILVFAAGSYLSLIDVALLVGMGLGIHLKQSKICAIILCAYAAINIVITIALTGNFGGWLIAIAGVFAVIYTFRLDKAWNEYRNQHGLM